MRDRFLAPTPPLPSAVVRVYKAGSVQVRVGASPRAQGYGMTNVTKVQRQLLMAALRSRGYITAVVAVDGNVSVGAGSERVRGPAAPLENLVAAQFLKLIGQYENRKRVGPLGEIRGVRLYELTSAGRAIAMAVESGRVLRNAGR